MPSLFVFYWCGVIVVVFWIGLLAAADMLATRYHLSRMTGGRLIDYVRLQAEINRHRAELKTKPSGQKKDQRDP